MDFAFPQTKDIQDVFGGGVFAAHQMMNNMDIARQYQQQKMAEQEQITRQKELTNQYDAFNNPIRLRSNTADAYGKELSNIGKQYENLGKARTERISAATESFQLDAAQKKLIQEASDADLKVMENLAQRMAYSSDLNEAEHGLDLLKMHKDFVKIREQGAEQRKTAAQQQQHAKDLEKFKQDQISEREKAKLLARSTANTSIEEQLKKSRNPVQTAEILAAGAMQALQRGDNEAAALYQQLAIEARQRAAEDASNRSVGAPGLGLKEGGGLAPKPRPTATAPIGGVNPGNPRSNATQPKHSLADVQKMYPGVPVEQLKQAYKQKFGIDLQ
jgi:hypothetical protein